MSWQNQSNIPRSVVYLMIIQNEGEKREVVYKLSVDTTSVVLYLQRFPDYPKIRSILVIMKINIIAKIRN